MSPGDDDVRRVIHEVYGRVDFWTRAPLALGDMVLDHVWPRAKGGPDSAFNLVPTTKPINDAKADCLDREAALAVLALIRTCYGPRVLRRLDRLRGVKPARSAFPGSARIWLLRDGSPEERVGALRGWAERSKDDREWATVTFDTDFADAMERDFTGRPNLYKEQRPDRILYWVVSAFDFVAEVREPLVLDLGCCGSIPRRLLDAVPDFHRAIRRAGARQDLSFGRTGYLFSDMRKGIAEAYDAARAAESGNA